MPENTDPLAETFARRVAERDHPPPPPPLSTEPAAVAARLAAWLRTAHGMRNPRGQRRLVAMLRALMQHPERTTAELAAAAGLGERAGLRAATQLAVRGLTTSRAQGLYRYHRLTRAAEDALLLLVAGAP